MAYQIEFEERALQTLEELVGLRVTQGEYRIIYAVHHAGHKVFVALIIKRDQGYRELQS